jgi:hypothetical protein
MGSMKTNKLTLNPMPNGDCPVKLHTQKVNDQRIVDALNEVLGDIAHHIDKTPNYTLTESELKFIFNERIKKHSKFLDIKCVACDGKGALPFDAKN